MDSIELSLLERRVRRSYEWSRVRRAVLGVVPLILVVLIAAWVGPRPGSTILIGSVAAVWGALLLWYGRDLRRAVLPGVAAGLIPLTFALCANLVGHVCTGNRCVAWCVPACVLGGLTAGLAVAAVGHRGRHGAAFWLSTSGLAVLTGAMGCACVGYSGVFGMVLGYAVGLLPAVLRAFHARSKR